MEAKLYLIPNILGNAGFEWQFPAINAEIAKDIEVFIVEDYKSGKRLVDQLSNGKEKRHLDLYKLNEHSNEAEIFELMQLLEKDISIGLISDAGMPVLADPGAQIIAHAHSIGREVVPLVGPSSIPLALAASGFNGQRFRFHGYLHRDQKQLIKQIRQLEMDCYRLKETQLFIEAPYRNLKLFETLKQSLKPETKLCIAAGILSDSSYVKTLTVKKWKETINPSIHKVPAVFLVGA